jgi:hypothetical protein
MVTSVDCYNLIGFLWKKSFAFCWAIRSSTSEFPFSCVPITWFLGCFASCSAVHIFFLLISQDLGCSGFGIDPSSQIGSNGPCTLFLSLFLELVTWLIFVQGCCFFPCRIFLPRCRSLCCTNSPVSLLVFPVQFSPARSISRPHGYICRCLSSSSSQRSCFPPRVFHFEFFTSSFPLRVISRSGVVHEDWVPRADSLLSQCCFPLACATRFFVPLERRCSARSKGCRLDFPTVEWLLSPFSFSVLPGRPGSVLPSVRFSWWTLSSATRQDWTFLRRFCCCFDFFGSCCVSSFCRCIPSLVIKSSDQMLEFFSFFSSFACCLFVTHMRCSIKCVWDSMPDFGSEFRPWLSMPTRIRGGNSFSIVIWSWLS